MSNCNVCELTVLVLQHYVFPIEAKVIKAHSKNFRKCRDDSDKKSMGTRVGMDHVQERPHVQLSTDKLFPHKYPLISK